MKIGILTFHWATNYGAVLQAFCLQEYLREQGHKVDIINYKPKRFDLSWTQFIKNPRRLRYLRKELVAKRKESLLAPFREKYLNQTKRYYSTKEIQAASMDYDLLISGSDQILNPSFTICGESIPTSAYYLSFGSKTAKRIGYAVSFGCVQYPKQATIYASEWINNFDAIGTRENTGLNILQQLGFKGQSFVVPDPTILYGSKLYAALDVKVPSNKQSYICVYMLRREIRVHGNVKYIDETRLPINMRDWLSTISSASGLITNSYHGMVMAILSHVHFAILLETGVASGMNDRFITLLDRLSLKERICNSVDEAIVKLTEPIDYRKVDDSLSNYRHIGEAFLKDYFL